MRFNPASQRSTEPEKINSAFSLAVDALCSRLEREPLIAGSLTRVEQNIPDIPLLSWLENNTGTVRLYWLNRDRTFAVAGLGAAKTLQATDRSGIPDLIRQIKKITRHHSAHFVGGVAFNEEGLKGLWNRHPFAEFILPEIEIVCRNNQHYLAVNLLPDENHCTRLVKQKLITQLKSLSFETETLNARITRHEIQYKEHLPTRTRWQTRVSTALSKVAGGELDKVVLCRQSRLGLCSPISAPELLNKWQQANGQGYLFCMENRHGAFMGNSPERLFLRTQTTLKTEAVAGTAVRGATQEEDALLEAHLTHDPKIQTEHQLVADYIQNRLHALSDAPVLSGERSVIKLAQVQHLSTPFRVELKPGICDSEILLSLHPTPAVCGSPLKQSMDLINQNSSPPRGWYAGAIGVVAPDRTEFCVAIRSLYLQGNRIDCYAGVGLVEGSEAEAEWQEMDAKIKTLLALFNSTPLAL